MGGGPAPARRDVLKLRSGGTTRVAALATQQKREWVYNLWVNEIHTYAVGASQILVHNNTEECAKLVQLTINGATRWKGLGADYAAYVQKVLNLAKKVPAGINATKNGAVYNVIELGGTTVADIDGFGADIWYEIKVNLNSGKLSSLSDQLDREIKVAKSYGKELTVVTSVSMSSIDADRVALCQKLGIKIVSLN